MVEKSRVDMSFSLLERFFNPMVQKFMVEKSRVEKFMDEKSGVKSQRWTFQPFVLNPGVQKFTVEKSRVEMSFSLLEIFFKPRVFNNPMVQKYMVEMSRVDNFMVGPGLKLGVEKFGVEMSFNLESHLSNDSRSSGSLAFIILLSITAINSKGNDFTTS